MTTLIEVEDLAIEGNLDKSRVQILLRFNKIVICETNLNIITEHLFSMSQWTMDLNHNSNNNLTTKNWE